MWKGYWKNWIQKFFTFLVFFWDYASMFITTDGKDRLFLYMRWKCIPYCVISYTGGSLVFSVHGTSGLRKQQMAELLSMNYHGALCTARWTTRGTILHYRLPVRDTNGLLKTPTCIGTKRTRTHLSFYSTILQTAHTVQTFPAVI